MTHKDELLIRVGYWYSTYEPHLPNPVPTKWNAEHKKAVIDYLNQQPVHQSYRGRSTCRVCGISNGSTCKSDGFYVWPEGLTHYIEEHDTSIPRQLVEHILFSGKIAATQKELEAFGEIESQKNEHLPSFCEKRVIKSLADHIEQEINKEILQDMTNNHYWKKYPKGE